MASRNSPNASRQDVIQDEVACSIASSGLSALTGWRAARTDSASAFTGCIIGLRSENAAKRSRLGCAARIASAACSVTMLRTIGATSVW